MNKGVTRAERTPESAEYYTPYYAVQPLLKYIPKDWTVWCPFDAEWSAFYNTFKDNGYNVMRSHIDEGQDFFEYEPENYDVIVSNPPYNVKDDILKRLYELNKPYAMLLPISCLQSGKRFEYLEGGVQLLSFDKRISFHTLEEMNVVKANKSTPFATAYFCKDILPRDLILERLNKFDKALIEE